MNPLARGQSLFGVLAFDSLGSAAFADLFLFIAHLRDQVSKKPHIGFEARGRRVHARLKRRRLGKWAGIDAFGHVWNPEDLPYIREGVRRNWQDRAGTKGSFSQSIFLDAVRLLPAKSFPRQSTHQRSVAIPDRGQLAESIAVPPRIAPP